MIWVDSVVYWATICSSGQKLSWSQVKAIKRQSQQFEILHRRWVVKRAFAWY